MTDTPSPGPTRRIPLVIGGPVAIVAMYAFLVYFGNVGSYTTEFDSDASYSATGDVKSEGSVRPPQFRFGYVQCMKVECSPDGDVCRGFERTFACDGDVDAKDIPAERQVVQLELTVDHDRDPSCFMPLSKEASVSAKFTLNLQAVYDTPEGRGERVQNVAGSAKVSGTMTGVGSCFEFRRLLGAELAKTLAAQVSEVVQKN